MRKKETGAEGDRDWSSRKIQCTKRLISCRNPGARRIEMEKTFPQGFARGQLTDGCLILESGAFRGIYQQGALDALLEEGIRMQSTIGISVGALNGAAYTAGQIGQAIRFTIQNIGNSRFVGPSAMKENHGPIGFRFMFEQLADWDEKAMELFFDTSTRFVVAATNMLTGKPEYFERIQNRKMTRMVQASATIPYLSRPVVIDGIPYLDGGCTVRIPWKWAVENGYKKQLIIRTRPVNFRYQVSRAAMLAARARFYRYPDFAKNFAMVRKNYNKDAAKLEQLYKQGKIYMIAPSVDLLDHFMQMDKDTLCRLYWNGYHDVKSQIGDIRTFLS